MWFKHALEEQADVDTLYAYAGFLKEIGDTAGSKLHYELAIELDFWHTPSLSALAELLSNQVGVKSKDDEDEVVDLFIRALTTAQGVPYKQKTHVQALLAYAVYLVQVHNVHTNAQKYIEQALEINPKHCPALMALANIHRVHSGDLEQAALLYERAMAVDSQHSGPLHGLGCIRQKQKRLEEAKVLFLAAL